jgi:hypothetical protein
MDDAKEGSRMKESGPWLVAVSKVSLCPKGDVELPESGWIALRFDREREFNLRAGRVVRVPNLFEASICADGVSLVPPEGAVLEFYKLDQQLDDPIGSGIVIDLPEGVILKVPKEATVKETVRVRADGSAEFPPNTVVLWPKLGDPTVVPQRTLIKSTKGVELFWLNEGDSFVLPRGGAARIEE